MNYSIVLNNQDGEGVKVIGGMENIQKIIIEEVVAKGEIEN